MGQNSGKVKVSIIIPVYNTESYLRECLDSVLLQSFRDIEIICIDDGSTDGGALLLDEYGRRDDRIRVIHKENGGLVSARKLGVQIAGGRYIGFVDSDDWIDPEMFERLVSAAENHGADIVSSNYWQEGAYSNISRDAVEPGVYGREGMERLRDHAILDFKKRDKGLSGSLCTKIFRASMLREVMPHIPEEIKGSEDKITTVTFLLECNKAVVLDGAWYHYRISQDSMSRAGDPECLLNCHRVYTYFQALYRHRNFTDCMRRQAELYLVQLLVKGINTRMGFSFRNLMWIDPAWMDAPGLGRRVALWGRGDLGLTYETQIRHSRNLEFAGYVDEGDLSAETREYDSIVITSKDSGVAKEAGLRLAGMGVPEDKIFWFKQEEIFWRYAEAMGLLDEGRQDGQGEEE